MRLSSYYLPVLKENPVEAQIISHRLMLRAGMIAQTSSGIYSWLPLGLRVLNKIANIVREEQDKAGAQELLMPTIQSADLWRQSGRYEDYGKEMLRITDRHDRDMLFGPTAEEVITELFARSAKSYRDLPKILYNIQWKFRDEIRPRFGVMRGREFLMKDAYSFDLDFAGAKKSYNAMLKAYLKTFARLGLKAIPVKANPGAIGGDLSQEFHIVAQTGESELFYDGALESIDISGDNLDVDALSQIYAAADEMHDPETCPVPEDRLKKARGIEIGHIFYFGTKYSEPFGAKVTGPDGSQVLLEMGSYGIGVSRLVAAIIEASHDEKGIIWPESVAPFKVGLLNLKVGDSGINEACEKIYQDLQAAGVEVLYDDRDERAGAKFATHDLLGLPWQIVVGPQVLARGMVELKNRKTGEAREVPLGDVVGHPSFSC